MQLLMQSYDAIELQRLRAELEQRRIKVHISDEFTYAIPGMPGAEQPRGIWVDDDDLLPARQVVVDLFGEQRVATDNRQGVAGIMSFGTSESDEKPRQPKPDVTTEKSSPWLTKLNIGLILLVALILILKLTVFSVL